MKKEYNNWIEEMLDRESLPRSARTETTEKFCNKWHIAENTYYYNARKDVNQKKILNIALSNVKKEAPEMLTVLVEKGKRGDMKAMDMYLNYVLKLAKQLDVKSDGKPLPILGGIIKE